MNPNSNVMVGTDRGTAMCTAWAAMDVPWSELFSQPAFTVEMWAMPKLPREWLVTCVYPEGGEYPQLGWGLEVGCQGELAARIVEKGKKSRVVWNRTTVADGR